MGLGFHGHHGIGQLQIPFHHLTGHGQRGGIEHQPALAQCCNRFNGHRAHIAAAHLYLKPSRTSPITLLQLARPHAMIEPLLGKAAAEVVACAEKENSHHHKQVLSEMASNNQPIFRFTQSTGCTQMFRNTPACAGCPGPGKRLRQAEQSITQAPPALIEQEWQRFQAAGAPGLSKPVNGAEQKRQALLQRIRSEQQQLGRGLSDAFSFQALGRRLF